MGTSVSDSMDGAQYKPINSSSTLKSLLSTYLKMMTTYSSLDTSVVSSAIIEKKKNYEAGNLYFLVPYEPLL